MPTILAFEPSQDFILKHILCLISGTLERFCRWHVIKPNFKKYSNFSTLSEGFKIYHLEESFYKQYESQIVPEKGSVQDVVYSLMDVSNIQHCH